MRYDERVIGNNIKKILKDKEMNQSDLADILGISRQTVSLWVLGKLIPPYGKILEIADALEVSPVEIADDGVSVEYIKIGRRVKDRKALYELLEVASERNDSEIRSITAMLKEIGS